MSIFEALYFGKMIPFERGSVRSPEYLKNEHKINAEREYFSGKLSPDDCERFRDMEDLYVQAAKDDEINSFTYGFTMGAMIMHEIMECKDYLMSAE